MANLSRVIHAANDETIRSARFTPVTQLYRWIRISGVTSTLQQLDDRTRRYRHRPRRNPRLCGKTDHQGTHPGSLNLQLPCPTSDGGETADVISNRQTRPLRLS